MGAPIDEVTFRLIGFKARVRLIYEGPNPEIEEFERNLDPAVRPRLAELSDAEPFGLLAVTDNLEEPGTGQVPGGLAASLG